MAGEFKAIGQKIAKWLNEPNGWSQDLEFVYRTTLQLDAETRSIGQLAGYVIAAGKSRLPDSRDTNQYNYDFAIGIIERLSGAERDERIDELLFLHEEIEESILGAGWPERLADIATAKVTLAPSEPLPIAPYNEEKVKQGIFDSAIPITFWVVK